MKSMKRTKLKDKEVNPFKTILFGFLGYVIIGVALISLPFAQKIPVGFVDNLFNVVSAMSTTGLTTGSLSDMYTPFGKIILLGLIQLGAIGYMTLTSFLILSTSKKISTHRVKILSAEFSMPENFDLKHFISNIIIYTIIVEFIGTVLLCIEFSKLVLQKPLWSAIFHCVSAFSTAGFSIYADGLCRFQNDVSVNLIIAFLCYAGAIGFIVPMDIYRRLTHKSKEITFTTKIILFITVMITLTGSVIYIGSSGADALSGFFQVMSASTTAGFNTVDVSKLPDAALLVLIFAMIIGASPSGTGGGIKTTSVTAILGIITSVVRGHPEKITFLKRVIPANRVMTAAAAATSYMLILFISTLLMCIVDNHSFMELFFETTSALGTVGLSLGITPELSDIGKIILSITMFLGRIGTLTLGIAFFRVKDNNIVRPQTDLAV